MYRRSLGVSQCALSTLNVVVHLCVLYHKENLPSQGISDFKMIIGVGSHVAKGEVLIFGPSVARYRVFWLTEKLGSAHLAALALDATPDGMVSEMLRDQLLDHADAAAIGVRRGASRLVLS